MKASFLLVFFGAIIGLFSCSKTPDSVIQPKQMEDLLVDIHKSEALIGADYEKYGSTEQKQAVQKRVLLMYGIDPAKFDTSLMWYGENLDEYMEIYGRVIERLKQENQAIKDVLQTENTQMLSRSGDSVNVWKKEPYFTFEPRLLRNVLPFTILKDENFESQDQFVLRMRVRMLPPDAQMKIVFGVTYDNDSVASVSSVVKQDGWVSLPLKTDNTTIKQLFGIISVPARPEWRKIYTDSISIIRTRYVPGVLQEQKLPPIEVGDQPSKLDRL